MKSIHVPTEERLSVQVLGLTPEVFRLVAAELEDWFIVVDNEYKKTFVRGRNWKARGRKISERKRLRIVDFSPFPSRFANILRTVRRKLYEELHRRCLVLTGEQHGAFRQNFYILPYAMVPTFMKEVSKQNRDIDGLNKMVQKFTQTRHFKELTSIFEKHSLKIILNEVWTIEHVSVDVTPLALEPTTVKEMVETEYKRMYETLDREKRKKFSKLEREEQEGLDALSAELERKRKEIVVKGVEDMQSKITKIVQHVVAAKKLQPATIQKELDNLRDLAVSVGLDAVAESVIDPMLIAFNNPEKALELFGTKDLQSAVSGRIAGLIKNL